jgi:hypothetical protein
MARAATSRKRKASTKVLPFERRNPLEAAAELSEAFLGRPAETVTEYEEQLREHAVLSDLAQLLYFVVWDENELIAELTSGRNLGKLKKGGLKITFDGATRLASNETGTQLYIEGGDQAVDLEGFACVDPAKELIPLGRVVAVEYFAAKHHLGEADKQAGPYIHDFAEEWLEENRGAEVPLGVFPLLVYDAMNSKLSLAGGIYHIDLDMEGKYSAGLRD